MDFDGANRPCGPDRGVEVHGELPPDPSGAVKVREAPDGAGLALRASTGQAEAALRAFGERGRITV